MKKKSIFSFVLAICMLVPACFMLSACKEEHKHDFKNNVCTGCGELAEGMVAKIDNSGTVSAYDTFDKALNALEDNGTLTLYADVTVKTDEKESNYFQIGETTDKANETIKTYTINFGGHTLTSKKGGFDLYANLTLKNGKMVAEARNGIWVQNDAHLKIERDATVECTYNDEKDEGSNYAVVATQGAVVDVYGTVHSVYGTALSGNGTSGLGGIVCNIHDGAVVKSDKNVAIYMPNSRELNFLGGTVTGTTAVYIKSGTTTISGGTFNATLEEKASFVHNGNGCDATGDVIVVEACDYPGGNPTVNINGGTFNKVAEGTVRVAYYTYGEGNTAVIDIAPSLGIEVNK